MHARTPGSASVPRRAGRTLSRPRRRPAADGGAAAPLLELRAHYLAGAFVGVFTRWVAMPGGPTAEQAAGEVWGLLRGTSPDRGAASADLP
ncbi:hypothetical protein IQ279_21265 [Streptomyces verrucosisporus]|uniref:hypothetical protein n=1 Tax=Streptomyces verrucosisporus TaxID=1695161 RepID=UPI0019D26A73|nr:hypothetical protein [Streptomyces verrucosisporus]MBN3932122.1 hypothetical protein [Streptomyces verrucosisporus]